MCNQIAKAIDEAVQGGQWLGAVVAWGNKAGLQDVVAGGNVSAGDSARPMTPDAIFDLASMTKVVATAPLVARCFELGELDLDDPVIRYVRPKHAAWDDTLTIRHVGSHYSGFDNAKPDMALRGPAALEDWLDRAAVASPGETFCYACLNSVILGMVAETILASPLDRLFAERICKPLGMLDTTFWPIDAGSRVVPTGVDVCGVVNDESARRVGSPVGNAGVFSTASDLARYATCLLNDGQCDGRTVLWPHAVDWMTSIITAGDQFDRAVLWDRQGVDQCNHRPRGLSGNAVGHSGFTGQSLWIDRQAGRFVVVLTNRTLTTKRSKAESDRARAQLAEMALAQ